MTDIVPGPDNDYQATSTQTFSREVWNAVMLSLAARLKAREALEATFETLIENGTQAALDLISENVAPQLSDLSAQVTSLQAQLEDIIDAGTAPNALQLGAKDPAFYLALANATGTLPVAKVDGLAASISTAIDAVVAGAPAALDTLKEIADKLADEDDAIAALVASVAGKLDKAQNLADLVSASSARTNLGLGTAATKDVGAAANNVVQLDASGHFAAGLLADTTAAQAGTDANKLMTPARVSEAIAAMAKTGWKQIGSTITLASATAYVEQAWTAKQYKKIMLLCSGNLGMNANFDIRTSSGSVMNTVIGWNANAVGEVYWTLMPDKGVTCWGYGPDRSAASSFAALTATNADRARVSPGSGNLPIGAQFMFFGQEG